MAKLLIVLLALACFQASNAAMIKPNTELTDAEKGLMDELTQQCNKLIDSLKATLQSAINSGLNQLTGLKDKVGQMKDAAIAEAKKQFQGIMDKGLTQINDWKQKAQQMGVDVKVCVETSVPKIQALPKVFLDKEITCVTTEYDKAMTIIMSSQKIVTDLMNSFTNLKLAEKLQQCTGWSALSCLYNLISEVTTLLTALPGQVTQKVAEVTTFVSGIPARLQLCTVQQAMSMQTEVTDIVGETIECIKTKIGMTYVHLN